MFSSRTGKSAASNVDPLGDYEQAKIVMESLTIEDIESFPRIERSFVDLMWINGKAGSGGNAKLHSYRSPSLKGCGYGGHGGNVIFRATHLKEDFLHLKQTIKGESGGDGHDTSRGLHGKDIVVQVPLGTIVRKRCPTGKKNDAGRRIYKRVFWHQFLEPKSKVIIAKGGRGGVAPSSSKRNDGRRGEPGESFLLELELRLMNDLALLGFSNSGKTALLSAMTRHHTRIGPEPFSTTRPHIGVLNYSDGIRLRIMDLPSLEEGAYLDKLKGRRCLRHLYRTKLLVYVLDVSLDKDNPHRDIVEEFMSLQREAILFDSANSEKQCLIVATKCDMLHRDSLYNLDSLFYRLRARYPEIPSEHLHDSDWVLRDV
ncbi:GTP-binding protein [Cardiosporidium cionae]|uniref:GTP-binding protein n=1 Tax=Cardiosporidium cionae TaxID=476202 RepID=A0ABQ7JEE9_9APIC|nr:GTP-binding protein [Cardiosporidium cionae]|eukprot:KAF8822381.1 GTP-binding protein [Cardiosporidium cionae]